MNNSGQRQSTNVVDQTQNTSLNAPHSNPMAGALGRANAQAAADGVAQLAKDAANAKAMRKKNPLLNALNSMDAGAKQDKQATILALKSGSNPKVPIPTPRPDPNAPQPKVFRYDNNKG